MTKYGKHFINLNVPQKDESNRLGLMEFHRLWNKIQKYLVRSNWPGFKLILVNICLHL